MWWFFQRRFNVETRSFQRQNGFSTLEQRLKDVMCLLGMEDVHLAQNALMHFFQKRFNAPHNMMSVFF